MIPALATVLMLVGGGLIATAVRPRQPTANSRLGRLVADWRGLAAKIEDQAGLQMNLVAAAAVTAIAVAVIGMGFPGLLLSVVAFWFGPSAGHRFLDNRRRQQFERQLPDALETIAGGLRAGQGFAQAIAPVAEKFPEPVCLVFRDAVRQIKVGTPVPDALASSAAQFQTPEWRIFVDAVDALLRMGGNLADITGRAAKTIRRRQQIQGRLQTLTAQGRMQAWVMGSLPVVMILILRSVDPAMYQLLVGTAVGWTTIAIAAVLEVVAIVMMRRILAVDV